MCAVEVFPYLPYVLSLVFGFILSLYQCCAHLVVRAWRGIATGRRLSLVGSVYGVCNVVDDLLGFLVVLFLQLATGS